MPGARPTEWMRASLDGLSFDGPTVLEIKCPMNVRDQAAAKQGSVPPQYYAQLQHQLEVSRAAEPPLLDVRRQRGKPDQGRPLIPNTSSGSWMLKPRSGSWSGTTSGPNRRASIWETFPQDAGSSRQDQFSRARWSSIRRRWKSFSGFRNFRQFERRAVDRTDAVLTARAGDHRLDRQGLDRAAALALTEPPRLSTPNLTRRNPCRP